MSKSFINYGALVDKAMYIIVKESLKIFAAVKDPGEHHFFVSFVTKYPGVTISEKLRRRYPHEMTIVLQHMFSDLIIYDDSFSIQLSFDNQPEKLVIPFASLTAFADPSVKFGLQFRYAEESPENGDKINTTVITNTQESSTDKMVNQKVKDDNLISLDFRNKKRL
jgi:uncharacterized protein